MPKLYDKIKSILEEDVEYRNSDKKLTWRIWKESGSIVRTGGGSDYLFYEGFMKAISTETIRRTRQKVQADHPGLQSSKKILEAKKRIQDQKGTFVYREEFTGRLF